jgi:hypothetical protein
MKTAFIFLHRINQLTFVMMTCCTFLEVRTKFLNIILHELWLQEVKLKLHFDEKSRYTTADWFLKGSNLRKIIPRWYNSLRDITLV